VVIGSIETLTNFPAEQCVRGELLNGRQLLHQIEVGQVGGRPTFENQRKRGLCSLFEVLASHFASAGWFQ